VLLIQFFLFPVSFPETDNTKFILSRGDNDGVKATMQERQNTQTKFTVVVAGILHDECGFPIEFRGKREGQAALGNVLLVFGTVEGKTHLIYCYSNNCTLSRMEVGGQGRASQPLTQHQFDICNMASPLFAGFSAMCQGLPLVERRSPSPAIRADWLVCRSVADAPAAKDQILPGACPAPEPPLHVRMGP
jgi:hypothetical protein